MPHQNVLSVRGAYSCWRLFAGASIIMMLVDEGKGGARRDGIFNVWNLATPVNQSLTHAR
jgi:hypothetical protein